VASKRFERRSVKREEVLRVKPVTGCGITTSVAMEAADLGIMRWDPDRNAIAAMFGDNFELWGNQGEWLSPSIVMYDQDYNPIGVPIVENGQKTAKIARRKQIWNYRHDNGEYTTVLPCDFMWCRDRWYAAVMVTAELCNELRTSFVESEDLVNWTGSGLQLRHKDERGRPIGHPGNVMLTFDMLGEWVYIFGTGGLARDKPLWLWRNKVSEFPHGWWEPWGRGPDGRWGWGIANEGSPIMGGAFGELCFRVIAGNAVLSYFDPPPGKMVCRCTDVPWGDWTNNANVVDYAHKSEMPFLYGGYISPLSQLDEPEGMHFFVSQWDSVSGKNDPYHVILVTETLASRVRVPAVAIPGTPEEPEVTKPKTIDDLLEELTALVKELAASADVEIVNPEGKTLTLREAVADIFCKERFLLDLKDRPRDPGVKDDQLGHVLSARAEGLINQAILEAIVEKLNASGAVYIDLAAIRRTVIDSFSGG
jgi:hypothetical protein